MNKSQHGSTTHKSTVCCFCLVFGKERLVAAHALLRAENQTESASCVFYSQEPNDLLKQRTIKNNKIRFDGGVYEYYHAQGEKQSSVWVKMSFDDRLMAYSEAVVDNDTFLGHADRVREEEEYVPQPDYEFGEKHA